ncbi:transposase [Candidatus Peregrinibacteria bacterium]|nr:transposase [Candidatus Peregrinibacteria bacterium]
MHHRNPFHRHRNSQKRFYEERNVYFITSNTYEKFPYFQEEIFCELWIEELKLCKLKFCFDLYAFCLNYEHFHWMIQPNEKWNISKVMKFFKENVSRDINKIIKYQPPEGAMAPSRLHGDNNMRESDTASCRLQMDTKISIFQTAFLQKNGHHHSFPNFQWQKSFHDHVIRGDEDFENHVEYTIYNFVKHGLPENWKYTSLNYSDEMNFE